MLLFNTILFCLLSATTAGAAYAAYTNHKRKKQNDRVAAELDSIIQDVMESVETTKKCIAKKSSSHGTDDITSPEMLSTLVTVLVGKVGGTISLKMADFARVPDDDYVSVYVDSVSQEIILSLDHSLTEKDKYGVFGPSDPDDPTFH